MSMSCCMLLMNDDVDRSSSLVAGTRCVATRPARPVGRNVNGVVVLDVLVVDDGDVDRDYCFRWDKMRCNSAITSVGLNVDGNVVLLLVVVVVVVDDDVGCADRSDGVVAEMS
jgi:hypothetical protein